MLAKDSRIGGRWSGALTRHFKGAVNPPDKSGWPLRRELARSLPFGAKIDRTDSMNCNLCSISRWVRNTETCAKRNDHCLEI